MNVDPGQLLTQLKLVIEEQLKDVRETTHEIQVSMVRLEGQLVRRAEFDAHKEAVSNRLDANKDAVRESLDAAKAASVAGDDAIKLEVAANKDNITTLATKVKVWGSVATFALAALSLLAKFI